MKHILSIALLATSLAATSAQALIVGASAGYLVDSEEEYVAARIGHQFSADQTTAHIAEFEIGFTNESELGLKAEIVPLTFNYRLQFVGSGKLGGYAGVGAGASRIKVKGYGVSDDSWTFTAQAFGGISYKVSDSTSINLGARYISINEVKLFSSDIEVGDDVAIEAGFQIKF